jgi:hypothetical protein
MNKKYPGEVCAQGRLRSPERRLGSVTGTSNRWRECMRWANVPLRSSREACALELHDDHGTAVPLFGCLVARIDRTKRELEISAATNRLIVSGVLVAAL